MTENLTTEMGTDLMVAAMENLETTTIEEDMTKEATTETETLEIGKEVIEEEEEVMVIETGREAIEVIVTEATREKTVQVVIRVVHQEAEDTEVEVPAAADKSIYS